MVLASTSSSLPMKTELHFKNICLHVHPGEFIGIVGSTGAGKSTLFNLIQRFADPLQGSITLNGLDLKNWELASLRQQYAYVPQNLTCFRCQLLRT